jgi:hypothetical protein
MEDRLSEALPSDVNAVEPFPGKAHADKAIGAVSPGGGETTPEGNWVREIRSAEIENLEIGRLLTRAYWWQNDDTWHRRLRSARLAMQAESLRV